MEQVYFKEANNSLGAVGKKPVPAYTNGDQNFVVTCWRMSFWERVRALFLGHVWVCTIANPKNVQPSVLSTDASKIFGKS